MAITFDSSKRDWILRERQVDFAAAETVFAGPCFSFLDERREYGEDRIITVGYLVGRMVIVG